MASATPPTMVIDPRTRTQIVVAVMLGLFLAALDQTIVGTALPRVVTDLRGNDIYTWAFTAYLLTATISGPIYGKLSDLFGRRPVAGPEWRAEGRPITKSAVPANSGSTPAAAAGE